MLRLLWRYISSYDLSVRFMNLLEHFLSKQISDKYLIILIILMILYIIDV